LTDVAAEADPDAALAEQGAALADAIVTALPGWSTRVVEHLLVAHRGAADPDLLERATRAGREAAETVGPPLRTLLAADVDQQHTNPLSVVRDAVRWPAEVLRDAGVPPVVRDEHDERHFPDDVYGLTPMTFADIDPALHDLGIVWGAWKARAHLVRHRRRS
jgi:hypothetical protein